MTLSAYHQKYSNRTSQEIAKRAHVKEEELENIFSEVSLKTMSKVIEIGVLGCGDKRYIQYHREIFSRVLNRSVNVTTMDIAIEHLLGEKNIIQHDVTQPFPGGPYDITYGHVLLKFIETEKQWNVLHNSYIALKKGGLAIHVLDKEEYEASEPKLPDGYFSVPLKHWKQILESEPWRQIDVHEVLLEYGKALVLQKKE